MRLLLSESGNNQKRTHADHLSQRGLPFSEIPGIALSMRNYFNFITTTIQKMMQIWKLFHNGRGELHQTGQEYLKSCGKGKKQLFYVLQYNVFITAYPLNSLTNKMTNRLLKKSLVNDMKLEGKVHRSFPDTKRPRFSLCLHLLTVPSSLRSAYLKEI